MQLVYFPHGFVEDSRDDSAMAVPRWTGKFLAQAKPSYKAIPLLVIHELQSHAVGIISAASKTIIFLQPNIWDVVAVAVWLLLHTQNSIVRAVRRVTTEV